MSSIINQRTKKDLRGGVIPYSEINGDIYILLGKENGKWSPFAGHSELNEEIKKSAVREFLEEIMGFFNENDVINNIDDGNKIIVTDRYSITHLYLFNIEFDQNLPYYYENTTKFLIEFSGKNKNKYGNYTLCKNDPRKGLFEKESIGWFSLNDYLNINLNEKNMLFSYKGFRAMDSLLEFFRLQI